MIVFEDVEKVYSLGKGASVTAVTGVNLEIARGEFAVIVGRSGSGKTTLLNLAGGLTQPSSGRITLDGEEMSRMDDRQQSYLRNRKIGFVFQFSSLLPTLTVSENVFLPTTFSKDHLNGKAEQRARDLLAEVGLSDKLNAFPRQLSAGQQQRVVIARALMNHPEIILADEPTSNLDESTEQEIMAMFHELHAQMNLTILLVTHTTQLVKAGMRKVEMVAGHIVQTAHIPEMHAAVAAG